MATRTYSIAPITHLQITALGKHLGTTQSAVIREAIERFYKSYENEINSAVQVPEDKAPESTDIF